MKVLRNKNGKKEAKASFFFLEITSTKGEEFCYDKGG